MFGIVAVGTFSGHIYLIDLRSDDKHEKFSMSHPSSLLFVEVSNVSSIGELREVALREDRHCCVDLNGVSLFLFNFFTVFRRTLTFQIMCIICLIHCIDVE